MPESINKYTEPYFNFIDNYIYIYHLKDDGEFVVLPLYPDQISDQMSSSFTPDTPIARSAPVFSYSQSGPRSISFSFSFHREMLNNVNKNVSNLRIDNLTDDDYMDTMIKKLQACALPRYVSTEKLINPPMVAVKIGEDIFIKGVVDGGVTTTFKTPILDDNKYALVDIAFSVKEVDPYSADVVAQKGSFRGITKTFKTGLYTK